MKARLWIRLARTLRRLTYGNSIYSVNRMLVWYTGKIKFCFVSIIHCFLG